MPAPRTTIRRREKHGRKYKAPPDTSHIEVTVVKGFNKKPIMNAAVIFHPVKDGKDEGNLEMKSDPDGKAVIDVIPTGSAVRIQVIADGFATFAEDYQIDQPSRQILITMVAAEGAGLHLRGQQRQALGNEARGAGADPAEGGCERTSDRAGIAAAVHRVWLVNRLRFRLWVVLQLRHQAAAAVGSDGRGSGDRIAQRI